MTDEEEMDFISTHNFRMTGEMRPPNAGEWALGGNNWPWYVSEPTMSRIPYIILEPVERST